MVNTGVEERGWKFEISNQNNVKEFDNGSSKIVLPEGGPTPPYSSKTWWIYSRHAPSISSSSFGLVHRDSLVCELWKYTLPVSDLNSFHGHLDSISCNAHRPPNQKKRPCLQKATEATSARLLQIKSLFSRATSYLGRALQLVRFFPGRHLGLRVEVVGSSVR